MVLAEEDFDADILNPIAGNHASVDAVLKALFDGGQKVIGNRTTDDRIDPQKVVAFVVVELTHAGKPGFAAKFLGLAAGGERKHADVNFAELPATAALLFVAVASFGVALHGLAIGNFRLL